MEVLRGRDLSRDLPLEVLRRGVSRAVWRAKRSRRFGELGAMEPEDFFFNGAPCMEWVGLDYGKLKI